MLRVQVNFVKIMYFSFRGEIQCFRHRFQGSKSIQFPKKGLYKKQIQKSKQNWSYTCFISLFTNGLIVTAFAKQKYKQPSTSGSTENVYHKRFFGGVSTPHRDSTRFFCDFESSSLCTFRENNHENLFKIYFQLNCATAISDLCPREGDFQARSRAKTVFAFFLLK